jgi:hypothetical protein
MGMYADAKLWNNVLRTLLVHVILFAAYLLLPFKRV